MKILLVSFHFPPDAPMAATRAPQLARFLLEAGHDVRVLCATDPQSIPTQGLSISPDRVTRTRWNDPRAFPAAILKAARRLTPRREPEEIPEDYVLATEPRAPGLKDTLGAWYEAGFCSPDPRIGWRSPALEAAWKLFSHWTPDVVYATCPPHSTAVIAREIAKDAGAPLVLEFRDRWGEDVYSDDPDWRRAREMRLEERVLADAARIVTVSPVWAQGYADRFGAERVALSMNGFDPDEYPATPLAHPDPNPQRISLLYAGALYPGRRDPAPIFEGIARLGEDAARVSLTMVGRHLGGARAVAARMGVSANLTVLPPESRYQVIKRQYAADALLLLQWNDAQDAGTVPGKLFECIGARRPIIATGWREGVSADLIRRRGLGMLSNNPDEISAYLRRLLTQKRIEGEVAPLPQRVRDGLSRPEQFAALPPMLESLVHGAPRPAIAAE